MGKILLIEPQSILRQAISLFLFPEYEVQVKERISSAEVGSLTDCDLLILDGAALRESDQLTLEVVRAIQGCKTPTLWLQEDDSSEPPERDKLTTVKKPIEREAFQSALASLLSHKGPATGKAAPSAIKTSEGARPNDALNKSHAEASSQGNLQFIELVDVVEEQPTAPTQENRFSKKSK